MGKLVLGSNRTRGRLMDAATAAAPFDPTTITGLFAWYDASDTSSITDVSGRASQINDKSGNARHMTNDNSISGSRPYTGSRTSNSLNVLDFQAAQYINYSTGGTLGYSTSTFTLFIYQIHDVQVDSKGLVVAYSGGNDWDNANAFVVESSNSSFQFTMTSNGANMFAYAAAGVMATGSYGFRHNSGVSSGDRLIKPGNVVTTSTLTQTGTASVGLLLGCRVLSGSVNTSFGWDGAIGEVLYYNAALSDADMDAVWGYLAAKWGA